MASAQFRDEVEQIKRSITACTASRRTANAFVIGLMEPRRVPAISPPGTSASPPPPPTPPHPRCSRRHLPVCGAAQPPERPHLIPEGAVNEGARPGTNNRPRLANSCTLIRPPEPGCNLHGSGC
ncbi:inverted formin-2-like [Schistocerca americana]|uniref:inverted formin-2-like n=1 Tax=Schistocerca americana TaxID=7009 RepID=UPI001F4FFBB5|nr:inverted formin-2-like [Schistocerca americana]